MDMARLEIPVSGWTCLRTVENASVIECATHGMMLELTLVDVAGVGFLPRLSALLLVTRRSRRGLLASLFLLSGRSFSSWGLAASGGLLLSSFWCHFEVVKFGCERREVELMK
jgi:hypothetical protein